MDDNQHALLSANAVSQAKQVATYASMNDCEHVALLNWDHLLLFEFDMRSKAEATSTTAGDTAKLTWVSQDRDLECKHVNEGNIRKALLGFALHAFEKHGISKVSP